MSINVLHSMALSGASKATGATNALTADSPSLDFSALLASQIADTSLSSQPAVSDPATLIDPRFLALTDKFNVNPAQESNRNSIETAEPTSSASIALLSALQLAHNTSLAPPRSDGKPTPTNAASEGAELPTLPADNSASTQLANALLASTAAPNTNLRNDSKTTPTELTPGKTEPLTPLADNTAIALAASTLQANTSPNTNARNDGKTMPTELIPSGAESAIALPNIGPQAALNTTGNTVDSGKLSAGEKTLAGLVRNDLGNSTGYAGTTADGKPAPTMTAGLPTNTAASLIADALPGNTEPAKVAVEGMPGAGGNFASILAAQEKPQVIAAPRHETPAHVSVPLNDPRWAEQVGDRVAWMARGEVQSAQINITPPQMGPIQINISLNGDQMSAHFVALNPEVRQALDEAMPRLREMLSGAGINLGQANVGSQTPQQQQQTPTQFGSTPRLMGEDAILSPDKPVDSRVTSQALLRGRGLVDLFA